MAKDKETQSRQVAPRYSDPFDTLRSEMDRLFDSPWLSKRDRRRAAKGLYAARGPARAKARAAGSGAPGLANPTADPRPLWGRPVNHAPDCKLNQGDHA